MEDSIVPSVRSQYDSSGREGGDSDRGFDEKKQNLSGSDLELGELQSDGEGELTTTAAVGEEQEEDDHTDSNGNGDNNNDDEEEDDDSKYPSASKAALLTAGLCIASFTTALDNTIIATAIPKITAQFSSINDVGWYGSAYLLTQTALQPIFGKIYTQFDVKWTYLIALVIFEAGSALCAAAPTSNAFIGGRALAGVGGAGLYAGGMNVVATTVPMRRRPLHLSLLTSMFGIASVVGPLMGGAFTDSRLTWRWCFWINLPVGAVAFAAVALLFRMPPRATGGLSVPQRILKIDLVGAGLFVPAIVSLMLALQWGGIDYPWSDSRVWGCLLCFGLVMIVFVATQVRRRDDAMVPFRILRQRTVLASTLFILFLSLAIYAHFYYLPFYFQVVQGTSAVGSGIRTIPYIVCVAIFAVVAGITITTLGYYAPLAWIGGAIFVVAAGLLYTLEVDTPVARWVGYQVLAGVGAGAALELPFVAVQVVVSAADLPVANGLVGFFNSLGSAVGVSAAQNVFSSTLGEKLRDIPGLDVAAVINAGATGARDATPAALLPFVLQAFNDAVTRTFIIAIAAGVAAWLVGLFFESKSVKGKKLAPHGA